jgi:VWFA-related protein
MQQPRIRTACVVVAVVLTATLSAQQRQSPPAPAPGGAAQPAGQGGDQTTPTFRGGINFVRVDATVTDKKGQPVTDLKASDFEVTEDGKPQTVEQFKLIRVDGNPRPGDPPLRDIKTRDDEETEAARDDVRVFVFFMDDYHVRKQNALSMRQTLTRFINTQLRPMDLVAVMVPLEPVAALGFTRNLDAVRTQVQQFEGRKYDYTPRSPLEEQYARYPAEVIENLRNDIVMSALRGLSVRLGSLREARKTVIFVSEGFTVLLPEAMRRQDAQRPDLPCINSAAVAIGCNPSVDNPLKNEDNPNEDRASWFAQSDLELKMRDLFNDANRNNVSIYTIDPRGLATSEFGIDENIGPKQDAKTLQVTQDTLRVLAEQTDGRAIVNRNSLDAGLKQIAEDASFYYLLGYTSSQAPIDGKFHEIKVRVKRSGIDVRARKGYWALTREDLERVKNPAPETAKPVQQALASIATSVQSGKYVRTWIGTDRGENGKTRVTLIWEPLPSQPGVRRDAPGRVSVLAASEKGDLLFRGRAPETPLAAPTGAASTAPVLPQKLTFEVPPGKVELRMTVEGTAGVGTLDQEIRTIDVPDLTAPQVGISTPRVFRARTVPELRTFASDPNATPFAQREFSRTERLLIKFDTYGPGTDHPAATAALMNRSGQKMSDLQVAPAAAGSGYQLDVPLNSIPPGEYVVEITAKGSGAEKQELVAFRVTG